MGQSISFRIPGQPVPQPRHRSTRTGRHYLPARHPVHGYKLSVRAAVGRLKPTFTAWRVTIEAVFARPRSHLTARGTPRSSAAAFPGHGCGDLDNLAKSILDALTGLAWHDDTQVTGLTVTKRWADAGEQPGTAVQLEEL